MKQTVFLGNNAIAELETSLHTYKNLHLFIVRGKKSYSDCGAEKIFNKIFADLGCKVTDFTGFQANPTIENVEAGIQLFDKSGANYILAVGGGSALDTAKLIRHYLFEKHNYRYPLTAVPTTAGTGAEATHFAVVYIDNKKQSIEGETILPDTAVIYPPFTYNNSKYLTACTGFDALAQAIESYWAKGATTQSKEYAVKAIELLWNNLPETVNNPSEPLRDKIAQGAYLAGCAINISKTTAPHAFSYTFTSRYGYPHGHAVALTFPFFIQLNSTPELLQLLHLDKDNCLVKMEEYIESIGLSQNLNPNIDIPYIVSQVNIQRLQNNPIMVNEKIADNLVNYLKIKQ